MADDFFDQFVIDMGQGEQGDTGVSCLVRHMMVKPECAKILFPMIIVVVLVGIKIMFFIRDEIYTG